MKVLVVKYEGRLSFLTRDIVESLKQAGHEVVCEAPEDADKIRGMKFDFCLVDEEWGVAKKSNQRLRPLHQSK